MDDDVVADGARLAKELAMGFVVVDEVVAVDVASGDAAGVDAYAEH